MKQSASLIMNGKTSTVDVKEQLSKFISHRGTRYVALVELPLPDDDALYIKYQDGRIQEAFSRGSISIFDAENELRSRIESGQVMRVETGTEEIEDESRPVLYLYYLKIEKQVITNEQGKVEKIIFSSKGFYVEATPQFLELQVSDWTNGKAFWDTLRIQLEPDPNGSEPLLFFQNKREAEHVSLLDLMNTYIYPLWGLKCILEEAGIE